jgi:hypothetical protein
MNRGTWGYSGGCVKAEATNGFAGIPTVTGVRLTEHGCLRFSVLHSRAKVGRRNRRAAFPDEES